MTPSELAKVREALAKIAAYAESDWGSTACDTDGWIGDGRCHDRPPHVHGINDYARMILDEVKKLVSILDREAGRKTRTHWRVEYQDDAGQWLAPRNPAMSRPFSTREAAENVIKWWSVPGRILEVTESWEEPKP